MNDVITAISTVGFPIVMCLLMYYQTWTLNENHKEEINSLKDSLETNTLAIEKLTAYLDKGVNNG